MKKLIILLAFLSTPLLANDYLVHCKAWEGSKLNFSLEAEVELTGGSYIDAWVTLKVFDSGNQIQSLKSVFSFGAFFIDRLYRKQVLIFELKPAGGQQYKYDFISIAANHPLPSGNSWLTYQGKQYQAECTTRR
jgi:hypothetical protein